MEDVNNSNSGSDAPEFQGTIDEFRKKMEEGHLGYIKLAMTQKALVEDLFCKVMEPYELLSGKEGRISREDAILISNLCIKREDIRSAVCREFGQAETLAREIINEGLTPRTMGVAISLRDVEIRNMQARMVPFAENIRDLIPESMGNLRKGVEEIIENIKSINTTDNKACEEYAKVQRPYEFLGTIAEFQEIEKRLIDEKESLIKCETKEIRPLLNSITKSVGGDIYLESTLSEPGVFEFLFYAKSPEAGQKMVEICKKQVEIEAIREDFEVILENYRVRRAKEGYTPQIMDEGIHLLKTNNREMREYLINFLQDVCSIIPEGSAGMIRDADEITSELYEPIRREKTAKGARDLSRKNGLGGA